MAFKVITGIECFHQFNIGDIVTLVTRNYPIPGLDVYQRADGVKQSLDKYDVIALEDNDEQV